MITIIYENVFPWSKWNEGVSFTKSNGPPFYYRQHFLGYAMLLIESLILKGVYVYINSENWNMC